MDQIIKPQTIARTASLRAGSVAKPGVFLGEVTGSFAAGAFVQAHFALSEPAPADAECRAVDINGRILATAPCLSHGGSALARLRIPETSAPAIAIWLATEQPQRIRPENISLRVRPHASNGWLPHWRLGCARWWDGAVDVLSTGEILSSQEISPEEEVTGLITFSCYTDHALVLLVSLRDLDRSTIKAGRYWRVEGIGSGVVPFGPLPPGRYAVSVVAQMLLDGKRPSLQALDVDVSMEPAQIRVAEDAQLTLPHWGRFERWLHGSCRRSKAVNNFVQAIELRLGREELVSLPQYMSICPTGQCNALCDFCSVTINRTGIIKQQLGQDLLDKFLAPVRRTVQLYGLEGNGEPTLHRNFPNLLDKLTVGGSEAYLITNGSRFSRSINPSLMRLESINVSLNAASAAVHAAVMKLDCYDAVVAGLRDIVRMRGYRDAQLTAHANPRVSASFVVTNDNVHEVEDFLVMAENDLGVDVVYVRPLSELGNDLGAVEDLRSIVPFESDIEDAVEAVQDYRKFMPSRLDIRFDETAYHSVRPDPIGTLRRPPGFEGRLVPPRPRHWRVEGDGITVDWRRSRVFLSSDGPKWTFASAGVAVEPSESLSFRGKLAIEVGLLQVSVLGVDGRVLHTAHYGPGTRRDFGDVIEVGANHAVRIVLESSGPFRGSVDFMRLRKPAMPRASAKDVLASRRWEVCVAGADVEWSDGNAKIKYAGAMGAYLIKSYAIPVSTGSRVTLRIPVRVATGTAGVGILSADQSSWLVTAKSDGNEDLVLVATTGQNRSVRVVFYSASNSPLAAKADVSRFDIVTEEMPETAASDRFDGATAMMAASSDRQAEVLRSEGTSDPAGVTPLAAPVAQAANEPLRLIKTRDDTGRRRGFLTRLLRPQQIYCHKPWTDLHNFTVDGRMDVCCIATGPSQQRYALGNMSKQSFQEIWNGPTAKLFRRTVNSGAVLPPCARCPMSHAYQGMWLDPNHTLSVARQWLSAPRIFKLPLLRQIPRLLWVPLQALILLIGFRGFRKPSAAAGFRRPLEFVRRIARRLR